MDGEASRSTGRSVRLFLADGNVHGIIIAEVGNWNGKVLAAPRSRLPELLRRPEVGRTGIYVMTGPDPDRVDAILAYVGEADDLAKRMPNHLRSEAKDFADRFAFVVSSDETLTKGHVRYLEGRLIRLMTEAGSVSLANETAPDFQKLPEADKADMEMFLEQLRLLLPILGFDLFRRAASLVSKNDSAAPTFLFSPAGASARAKEMEEGFVVLSGSTARNGQSGTFPAGYQALRDRLILGGQLVEQSPGLLGFATDTVFTSASAAASIISGRSASGPLEWKLEGAAETYKDWQAAKLGR